jgi:hypothetical protein
VKGLPLEGKACASAARSELDSSDLEVHWERGKWMDNLTALLCVRWFVAKDTARMGFSVDVVSL